jgi:GntR family transcriptional regulator
MVHSMPDDVIDHNLGIPVYAQVAARVRALIESGEIQPQRPVPSTRTLVERYGVARQTAAKALGVLAAEGLIYRVPGRGWFVAERPGQRG